MSIAGFNLVGCVYIAGFDIVTCACIASFNIASRAFSLSILNCARFDIAMSRLSIHDSVAVMGEPFVLDRKRLNRPKRTRIVSG